MILGGTTIKKLKAGGASSGAFLGFNRLTGEVDRLDMPLLQPAGRWDSWALAPLYAPALAGQVFNVLDYGASPNNGYNSTQAIRDTLEAAKIWQAANANAFVTIYIPAGTYIVWRETLGSEDFIFTLHQDNMVIEGDGPDLTILNVRATGGTDPNTLVVARGMLFCTRGTSRALDGIKIRGLRMTGNAIANQEAGNSSTDIDPDTGFRYDAQGWDVNHKPVGIWDEVTNVIVEDCEMDNWRGEAVYAGGGLELGNMTVRRCLIYNNNASAISMGGLVAIQDCEIYDAYNGVECFMLGGVQTLTVTDCIIEPDRNDFVHVNNGIAYLGYAASELTVTGCQISNCISGVYLAEMASNVTVNLNDFANCERSVYGQYQGQYTGNPSVDQAELDRWEHITVSNNTSTASTRNMEAFMLMNCNTGLDWALTGNTLVHSGGFEHTDFLVTPSGAAGGFAISGNTIPANTRPIPPYVGPRPVWAGDNTVTGNFSNGTEWNAINAGPVTINPTWRKARIADISGSGFVTTLYVVDAAELDNFPEGFALEIRRLGSGDNATGVEIEPDATWNSLTRGYMLYAGGVLTLTVGVDGKFGFTSFTPNTVSIATLTDTNPIFPAGMAMNFYGQLEVNLAPAVAHVFTGHAGVAIGETVTINYNANTTIDHVPGNVEMSTGVDFVASGSGSLSATRDAAGVLQVTIP